MAPGCVDIIAAVYSLVLLCKQRTGNTYTVTLCLQEKQNSKLLVIANITRNWAIGWSFTVVVGA